MYWCLPIEFIQPWEQNDAIRAVSEHKLGNAVILGGTFHVGNSDEERLDWKRRYPHLAARIDAVPRFPQRPQLGMAALLEMTPDFLAEQLLLCRDLGLKVVCFYPSLFNLPASAYEKLAGPWRDVVLSESVMNENLSLLGSTLSLERLRTIDATPVTDHASRDLVRAADKTGGSIFDDPESLDFEKMQGWFVERFAAAGRRIRGQWNGALSAIEAAPQMRLAMMAGVEMPILELVPTEPMRGIAATRGAMRAYGRSVWGVHLALGYYRAPADATWPRRLRIASELFFAAGASIFTECNMPLRLTGSCAGFFSVRASPPIRVGEEEQLGFDHPLCAAARAVVADQHRFTQFHTRPAAHPRVTMGFLDGHLDIGKERMWFVDHPGFLAAEAAKMWRHADRALDVEPWYIPPRKYYWQADPCKPLRYGTPPCGQVDVVPIEAPPEVMHQYGALALLGWNTMTEAHYRTLIAYVRGGGILFLSVPHLSTRTRTDQPQRFIRDGDVRELCGVRILGEGDRIEEVVFERDASDPRCVMPRGTLYLEPAAPAKLSLDGARALAVSRDTDRPGLPILLEHRIGAGSVYLLNTWNYPGDGLDALITDILRTLADSQQGDIAVRSRDVYYAVYDGVFPSGMDYSVTYLVNHDIYGQAAHPTLIRQGAHETSLRVAGETMRIVWMFEDVLVSPEDRYVKITDARHEGGSWRLTVESLPVDGPRWIQIDGAGRRVNRVTLNGQPLTIEQRTDGEQMVQCELSGQDELVVE